MLFYIHIIFHVLVKNSTFFLFSIKVFTQLSIYKVIYYFIFNCDIKKNREMTRLEYSNIYLYIFDRNCTPETIMQPG